MQQFGKSFGQPVGQGLQHDLVVIVVRRFKFPDMFLDALDRYAECADMILLLRFGRQDEVGKRQVRLPIRLFDLLAEEFQFHHAIAG